METNIPGIYAIGDVIGGFMLAHVASREGITAAKNVMGGDERIDYSVVPVCNIYLTGDRLCRTKGTSGIRKGYKSQDRPFPVQDPRQSSYNGRD